MALQPLPARSGWPWSPVVRRTARRDCRKARQPGTQRGRKTAPLRRLWGEQRVVRARVPPAGRDGGTAAKSVVLYVPTAVMCLAAEALATRVAQLLPGKAGETSLVNRGLEATKS
jgi:hypothetical protein